jgi:hypothetical protein
MVKEAGRYIYHSAFRIRPIFHMRSPSVFIAGIFPVLILIENNSLLGYTAVYYCVGPDDRSSTRLWNVGLLQRDYTALYPRRLSIFFILAAVKIWNLTFILFLIHSGYHNNNNYTECAFTFAHAWWGFPPFPCVDVLSSTKASLPIYQLESCWTVLVRLLCGVGWLESCLRQK